MGRKVIRARILTRLRTISIVILAVRLVSLILAIIMARINHKSNSHSSNSNHNYNRNSNSRNTASRNNHNSNSNSSSFLLMLPELLFKGASTVVDTEVCL